MNNEVIKQWDDAARLYFSSQEESDFVKANKDVVRNRFNTLTNEKVLDLGCGYGCYSDYFRTIGGSVVGCDGSKEMLSIARDLYPLCTFEYADKEIYRITKYNGIFFMSIVHPAFYDCEWDKDQTGFKKRKIMERYLSEYSFNNEYWGKTKHFHRPVSRYINTIISSGFTLVGLNEPKSYDGKTKSDEFPLFLFAEFRK